MARITGTKNKSTAPDGIEQARKMARLKAIDAAPMWGLDPANIARRCIRGEIPGAVKLGQVWFVTPDGMDKLFDGKRKNK